MQAYPSLCLPCCFRQAVTHSVVVTGTQTASDVAATRIKEVRRLRGLSVRKLAELCKAAGASDLSENVIENIERSRTGSARRGRDVTLDQWLILARVLNTPPLALVLPGVEDTDYRITPQVSEPAARVGRWLAGLRPLPTRVPDPAHPGEFLPQHPGDLADREKQWFAELPSYLRTNVPDLDERVANEVARQLGRFLTPSTPPDAHESNQRTEDS
jgi:transcriptional regulator with XRE-family HTH domain